MVIQQRDRDILEALNRYGVLSTKQIGKRLFNGIAHSTMMRRLRELEAEMLILRHFGLANGELCFTLTKLGGKEIGVDRPFAHRNLNSFSHTTTLAEVRIEFETQGLGSSWTDEFELKRRAFIPNQYNQKGYQVIPDGLLVEEVFGGTSVVALELELTEKATNRYIKSFQQYRMISSVGLILYVVKDKRIGHRLLKIWSKTMRCSDNPRMGFVLLDELLLDFKNTNICIEGKDFLLSDVFTKVKNWGVETPTEHAQVLSGPDPVLLSSQENKIEKENRELNEDHAA